MAGNPASGLDVDPNLLVPGRRTLLSSLFDELADKLTPGEARNAFEAYQSDPVAFGQVVLGETFTPEIIRVMESVRDVPVTVAQSGNQVGKTHGAARVAIWFYLCFEDAQVYTTAAPPISNLRRQLWGEIQHVIEKFPQYFEGHRNTVMNIQRSPLSFVTGVAIPLNGTPEEREAKFSGKHAPHILFIVDEGDAVPDEVYRGIEQCMSGGYARLLVMFNPKLQSGTVYRKIQARQANVIRLSALTHPNVLSGGQLIPGAVDRVTTVRRINEWTRPLADGETVSPEKAFPVPDFLAGSMAFRQDGSAYPPLPPGVRVIVENAFYYMVLGLYPAEGEQQLIPAAAIADAQARYAAYVALHGERPPGGVRPVMALDVAEFGQDANSACLRYGGWVAPLVTWGGVDVDESAQRGYEIYVTRDVDRCYVDATGLGASIAPRMYRLGAKNSFGVKVASVPTQDTEFGQFFQLRDQLWWSVREWLRSDPAAMLPNDPLLTDDLRAMTYTKMDSGKIKVTPKSVLREMLKRSPDRGDSLCLTFSPRIRAKVLTVEDTR